MASLRDVDVKAPLLNVDVKAPESDLDVKAPSLDVDEDTKTQETVDSTVATTENGDHLEGKSRKSGRRIRRCESLPISI